MKNTFKYLVLASAMLVGFAACEKTEAPEYEAAPAETGAQVFFPTAPAATVKLAKEDPTLKIAVSRGNTADALDVPVAASGEATTWFNVPSKVSFGAGEKDAVLTVSAKDIETMEMNTYYPLVLSIDESLASLYGASELSFQIGISLPWITFDEKGTMVEGWWGETEPNMPMKYQQISATMRYCVVEDCWGHDTGAGYPVQPYTWYWDTETNYCYVPAQFMGYSTSSGDVYVGDEAAFYNLYWPGSTSTNPLKEFAGQAQGTAAWFEFCDKLRAAWAPDGDPFPYYDGEGKFYLGDYFFLMADGAPTGRGYQFGGTQDIYVCSFAVNYTIGVSYEGLLLDKNGEEQILGDLTIEGGDVTDVYALLVPGKDPSVAIDVLEAEGVNLEEVDNCVLLSAAGSFRIPMIEDAEAGLYTLVAVPVDNKGALAWDYGVYETFTYGELDPLLMGYTVDDILGGISKETLFGTTWIAFAGAYGTSPADREACAYVNFAEAEDQDEDSDLISVSGLANTSAFPDAFYMEWYKGYIYTLGAQQIGTYSSYDVYAATYSEDTPTGGNYVMVAGYVADGILAFVNMDDDEEFYGIAFWAVKDNSIAGYLRVREYLILVDPAILESGAGAPKKVSSALYKMNNIPFAPAEDVVRTEVPAYDWSRDVVASGRVMSFGAKELEFSGSTLR